jgi:hypothetical protein
MEQPQELVKSLVQYWQEDVIPAITQAVHTITETLVPIWQSIYASMYASYRNAGMPYGDNHEGFMRWLEDLKKIQQRQDEIEAIRNRHQHLIDVRNFGEKIRAKREQQ